MCSVIMLFHNVHPFSWCVPSYGYGRHHPSATEKELKVSWKLESKTMKRSTVTQLPRAHEEHKWGIVQLMLRVDHATRHTHLAIQQGGGGGDRAHKAHKHVIYMFESRPFFSGAVPALLYAAQVRKIWSPTRIPPQVYSEFPWELSS